MSGCFWSFTKVSLKLFFWLFICTIVASWLIPDEDRALNAAGTLFLVGIVLNLLYRLGKWMKGSNALSVVVEGAQTSRLLSREESKNEYVLEEGNITSGIDVKTMETPSNAASVSHIRDAEIDSMYTQEVAASAQSAHELDTTNLVEELDSDNNYTLTAPSQILEKTEEPDRDGKLEAIPHVGFVYLLRAGPFYKIGKSKDPEKRIKQIKLQLPYPVEIVHVVASSNMSYLETHWHKQFSEKRTNGEWFLLTDDDVARFVKQ